MTSAISNSADIGYLGIPYRGDEIIVRGRHVYDCGHTWGEFDGTSTRYSNYPVSNNQSCTNNSDCNGHDGCAAPIGCVGNLLWCVFAGYDLNGNPLCSDPSCSVIWAGGTPCSCSAGSCPMARSMAAAIHPSGAPL